MELLKNLTKSGRLSEASDCPSCTALMSRHAFYIHIGSCLTAELWSSESTSFFEHISLNVIKVQSFFLRILFLYRQMCSDKPGVTSGKRAFGLDPLVPASIWAGTKGPATLPQNGLAAREALVPARNEPLVPVLDTNRD
jgi:hypothetical protein